MTLIVGWIACDNKGDGKKPSVMYFGSDSRITWDKKHPYDYGKKIFSARKYPEIFAFCGNASFATFVLSLLIELIDSGAFLENMSPNVKCRKIQNHFQSCIDGYNTALSRTDNTVIIYGTKYKQRFAAYRYTFPNNVCQCEQLHINDYSLFITVEGRGKKEMNNQFRCVDMRTDLCSREICHYFASTIDTSADSTVGGLPQIVGLYRGIDSPRTFGFVKDGKAYLYGVEVEAKSCSEDVEWRNIDFERIDPNTLQLIEDAQAQPFLR